ncbi:uncharacterized protein LOC131438805 isoform X2 [Malaya genurostris]|nr:uncharacterized protein LOC131438805 isoform X2 [Malaya genurostris]
MGQKRPQNIYDFMVKNLWKISAKYKSVTVSVKLDHNSQYEKFVKVCSRVLKAPIIQINRPGLRKGLNKLPNTLQRFRLSNKNIIFMDKGDIENSKRLLKDFHVHQHIDLVKNDELQTKQNWRTILPTATDLRNTIKLINRNPNHFKVKYIQRIVLLGRLGSGTHRFARMLANRLDLVLVSTKSLVDGARQKSIYFKKTLEIGLDDNVHTSELITSIVEKRLLEPDCQRFGWILVDFPSTAEDVENFFRLLIAPQKVIYIHANERLCWKRKMNQIDSKQSSKHSRTILESVMRAEFNYFNVHQPGLIAALEKQDCVLLDINGNNKTQIVYKDIIKKLNVHEINNS